MKSHRSTLLTLACIAASAGAAHAQHTGDPGLDPRVAELMQPPLPVDWLCDISQHGGYADRTAPTLWPGGLVPFEIDSTVTNAGPTIAGMDIWMFRSGASPNVTFVRRDPNNPAHNNYIRIRGVDGGVSSSAVGMLGGRQDVTQGSQVNDYVMAHEYCHALGFYHEQSRPDRDTYVNYFPERVSTEYRGNFNVVPSGDWPAGSLNTGYDFDSVMHYFACAFSTCSNCACGDLTVACPPLQVRRFSDLVWQCSMGQQDHLSTSDVADMIAVYGQRSTAIRYVGPAFPPPLQLGTLTFPYQSPTQLPGPGDVYFQGGVGTYTVPAGTTFSAPGVWRKHSDGVATITGQ